MSDEWKKRLLPASWRGIPFFVESHELSGGRYAQSHEPPNRNSTFAEDIGRKGKVYKIDAHVLGDNYFFIRDGLVNAMEEEGKGILIHPYLGIKEVQPEGYSVRETTAEGRICRISMSFIEAGKPSFPFSEIDKVTAFITSAVVAVAQVKNAFQLAFKIAELPGFAKDSAILMLDDFTTTIDNGFKNVRLNGSEHSELKRKNDEVAENKVDLVNNPASLINEVDGIIFGLTELVPDPPASFTIDSTSGRDDKLAVFNDLLGFVGVSESIPSTTPTRTQERLNADALADSIQQLALIRLAEETVKKEFKSNQEAIDQRTLISEEIDRQLQKTTTSDETFQVLEDLQAKLVAAVPNTESEFNNVQSINQADSLPSIVMAYDLYESADNEQDIIDRNKLRHPGFAIGDLEVLSS